MAAMLWPVLSQLVGESAHQRLVGSGVHLDAFFGERDRQFGGVGFQLAARGAGGGGYLLLGGADDLLLVFFGGGADALFFRHGLAVGGGAQAGDVGVDARQPAFDLRQAPVGFLAGLARFL